MSDSQALSKAIDDADLARIGALIDLGAPIDGTPKPALVAAAARGQLDVVSLLLARGADPSGRGSLGLEAPLHVASSPEVVRALVAAGADLAGEGPGGTPLHYAAVNGTPKVIAALLAAGADPDARRKRDGWTPLRLACHHGAHARVTALMARPPSPHAVSEALCEISGRSEKKTLRALEALLAAGADPNVGLRPEGASTASHGFTALHVAVQNGVCEAVRLLLAHGASHSARASGDVTPAFLAALHLTTTPDRIPGTGKAADRERERAAGRLDVLWHLVRAGAELDVPCTSLYSPDGSTARAILATRHITLPSA